MVQSLQPLVTEILFRFYKKSRIFQINDWRVIQPPLAFVTFGPVALGAEPLLNFGKNGPISWPRYKSKCIIAGTRVKGKFNE